MKLLLVNDTFTLMDDWSSSSQIPKFVNPYKNYQISRCELQSFQLGKNLKMPT